MGLKLCSSKHLVQVLAAGLENETVALDVMKHSGPTTRADDTTNHQIFTNNKHLLSPERTTLDLCATVLGVRRSALTSQVKMKYSNTELLEL